MTRKKRITALIAALVIAMMSTVIFTSVSVASQDTFVPRLTAPTYDNSYYFSSKNIFYASGYGMPNCTAYAYGRAYEILGTRPSLPSYDARRWYELTTAYEKGQEPRVGSIAVWWSSSSGHVAVVEKIENGIVTFSNSSWSGTMFYLTTGKADGSDNFGGSSNWDFLGFIYLLDDDSPTIEPPTEAPTETPTEAPSQDVTVPSEPEETLPPANVEPIGTIGENELMRVSIKATSLAVRTGPSTSSSPIGYISTNGQKKYFFVSELYTDTQYCWGKIVYNGKEGWVALSPKWTENTGCFSFGDVNCDGAITIDDATTMQRVLAKFDSSESTELFDCNGDGSFDIGDCALVQKLLAGI